MEYRALGRTGYSISSISFGAWAIGGDAWGGADDAVSLAALHKAVDLGVNFFDTADVYGDGHSERLLARLKSERPRRSVIATKAGRRLNPHVAAGYNRANLTAFVERSLKNLATDALDLLQLHCPPTPVYDSAEVFGVLDDLVRAGKIRYYGVSVETVAEALRAIEWPERPVGADHLQPVPREACRALLRRGRRAARSASWRGCRWPAGSSAAGSGPTRRSRPATTGTSTAAARRSTSARRSAAWTTRRACGRPKS